MRNIIIIAFFGITASLVSCNTETKKEDSKDKKTDKTEEVKTDSVITPKEVEKTAEIVLNDGEKWKVNEEMIPFIKKGAHLVAEFLEKENKNDFQELAAQLAEQNQKLISSCTMNGKSHDELHKWLMPHLGLVSNLKKAESNEDAQLIVRKLDSSYSKYDTFFE